MRNIGITVAVGQPVHEAAKYAVGLLRHIDPAMLGQFVDYERLCTEIRRGIEIELPPRMAESMVEMELQESYLNSESHDPVFEYSSSEYSYAIKLVL